MDWKTKILVQLRDIRERATKQSSSVPLAEAAARIDAAIASLAACGITGIGKEDLKKLTPQDQYDRELDVMAEVRAYYLIAYRVKPAFFYRSATFLRIRSSLQFSASSTRSPPLSTSSSYCLSRSG